MFRTSHQSRWQVGSIPARESVVLKQVTPAYRLVACVSAMLARGLFSVPQNISTERTKGREGLGMESSGSSLEDSEGMARGGGERHRHLPPLPESDKGAHLMKGGDVLTIWGMNRLRSVLTSLEVVNPSQGECLAVTQCGVDHNQLSVTFKRVAPACRTAHVPLSTIVLHSAKPSFDERNQEAGSVMNAGEAGRKGGGGRTPVGIQARDFTTTIHNPTLTGNHKSAARR
ncbi:hypothetical protein V8E53_013896 [Lactarius tabidus]